MTDYLETLCWYRGFLRQPAYHVQLMEATLGFSLPFSADHLQHLAEQLAPPEAFGAETHYKFRFIYNADGIQTATLSPYAPAVVNRLQLVEASASLDYHLKYADRSGLDALKASLPTGVEPLIVKSGRITDTTYTNVAFLRQDCWYIPSSYLLAGTMRRFLLETQACRLADIRPETLSEYTHVCLINAMLKLGEVKLPIEAVLGQIS